MSNAALATQPPRVDILPGLWRLPLPLRESPLGHVNAYLVKGDDGYLLIDCGWDTADTLRALEDHLNDLGLRFRDIRHLVVTHIHADHYGLAGRLREITNADLRFHRLERLFVDARYGDAEHVMMEMREWLRLHGTPEDDLDALNRASTAILDRVHPSYPDSTLDGGEDVVVGDYQFRVIWTPGHSAGHLCLYEETHGVLISGDHVLEHITPSITLHAHSVGNPLADYLTSLKQIRRLRVQLVLPGHGDPFADLRGRADALIEHYERRMRHFWALAADGPNAGLSAYTLAQRVPRTSRRPWEAMTAFERRLAVTEALSHLELLHARGDLTKRFLASTATYSVD